MGHPDKKFILYRLSYIFPPPGAYSEADQMEIQGKNACHKIVFMNRGKGPWAWERQPCPLHGVT